MLVQRSAIVFILLGFTNTSAFAQSSQRLHPLPDLDHNVHTGPKIGERSPDFEAIDHNGNKQTFETLRGRKGLVLLFFRSADW